MTDYFSHEDSRAIAVKRWMIDATRDGDGDVNLAAALMLAQVTFWLSPSLRTGRVRADHHHAGSTWLVRADNEWEEELGLSERAARRARRRLAELGLIEAETFVDDGVRKTHIRRRWSEVSIRPETADVDSQPPGLIGGSVRPETADGLTDQAVTRAGASSLLHQEVDQEVQPASATPITGELVLIAGSLDESPASAEARVFSAWVSSTGRTRSVLDTKRRRLIGRALRSYPVEEVVAAVSGWQQSPFHRGENDRHTVYNDLELLLRDGQQIEKFRDLALGVGPVSVGTMSRGGQAAQAWLASQ